MYNETAYALGTNSCIIRDIAEYGARRAAEIGTRTCSTSPLATPACPHPRR